MERNIKSENGWRKVKIYWKEKTCCGSTRYWFERKVLPGDPLKDGDEVPFCSETIGDKFLYYD